MVLLSDDNSDGMEAPEAFLYASEYLVAFCIVSSPILFLIASARGFH
jgi:hypothetical protein